MAVPTHGVAVAQPVRLFRQRRARSVLRSKSLFFTSANFAENLDHEVDAVIILGGGLTPGGSLPEWVHLRVQAAAQVFRKQDCRVPVLCSGAGTPHRPPPLNPHGYVRHESTVLAEALLEQGVPADWILKETSSSDTLGNAYFCMTEHAIPLAWRRPLVITSAFHLPRSRAAFEGAFALARASGLSAASPSFLATPDAGVDPEVLRARAEREQESLEEFRGKLSRMRSLADFHRMLFTTHKCYAVSRQHEVGAAPSEMSELALKSY